MDAPFDLTEHWPYPKQARDVQAVNSFRKSFACNLILIAGPLGFPLVSALAAPSASKPGSESATVTVAIYDYAEVPPSELASAQGEAARIFHETGVGLKWLHYPVGSPEVDQGFLNPWRQTPDSLRLVLRILPRTMAERMGLSHFVFGFAMPAAKGEFPRIATVFYHRAEELARLRANASDETPAQKLAHRMAPLPMILGHLMAHEIGHLLLGRDSHSRSGIMSNPWSVQSLRLATAGKLGFSANQARTIRDQVRARSCAADLTVPKVTGVGLRLRSSSSPGTRRRQTRSGENPSPSRSWD